MRIPCHPRLFLTIIKCETNRHTYLFPTNQATDLARPSTSVIHSARSSPVITSPFRSASAPNIAMAPTTPILNLSSYPTVPTSINTECDDCGKYKNRIAKGCPEACCPEHCARRFLQKGTQGQRCVPHARHIANALALQASLTSSSSISRATRSTAAAAATASTPTIEEHR